jgi:hypothetical protein
MHRPAIVARSTLAASPMTPAGTQPHWSRETDGPARAAPTEPRRRRNRTKIQGSNGCNCGVCRGIVVREFAAMLWQNPNGWATIMLAVPASRAGECTVLPTALGIAAGAKSKGNGGKASERGAPTPSFAVSGAPAPAVS